jgi:hypothetical protein
MNTPRKLKRFGQKKFNFKGPPGGTYSAGLYSTPHAEALAAIASGFVHLEGAMSSLLGVLMGATDRETPGYILRSIKSPKGRIDVMEDLLQLAPGNRGLDGSFDEMIDEFAAVSKLRNIYVHGLWWTADTPDKEPYLAEGDEHGWGFSVSDKGDLEKMRALIERIWALYKRVVLTCGPMIAQRSNRATGQPSSDTTPETPHQGQPVPEENPPPIPAKPDSRGNRG